MRYIDIGGQVIPKHCIYGPRPAEGLVFNNLEWWSITDHLIRDQREKEMAAVMRAKEESKKQLSFNMTRNWNNTLASIKTLGDQRRIEKREREKQDKIDKYNEIIKNRKEEKKKIIADVKNILYEEKDAVKLIKSGIFYSTVLQERQKQIALKKSLEKEEAAKEMELAEKFKKDAEDFHREHREAKIKESLKRKRQKEDLDKQVADLKLKKKAEEEEFNREKQDLINMKIEGDQIAHCNQVEKNYRKEFAARFCRKSENQLEFERKLILEEEEEEEFNKIYMKYKRRFEKERKEREEKMLKDKVEQRVKVAEKLGEVLKEAARKEDERLEASAQEKERRAMMEQESKEKLRRQMIEDIIESKKKAEEKMAREKAKLKEMKKWEMIQTYKNIELSEEWKNFQRKRMKDLKAETRSYYDEQIKEMKERQAKDLAEWLAPLENEAADREELLKYCGEAMDFVKEYSLPPYPVLKAIEKAKKENGIWDEKTGDSGGTGNDSKKAKQERMRNGCYCLKY